jgi:hypothetical protein
MRVENLRFEKNGGTAKVAATVTWEDCSRPVQELYFETIEDFADSISCNPNAFLVACIMPAFHFGEERVLIEGEICPELKDGLNTVMKWMRLWYYKPNKKLPIIEAKTSSGYPQHKTPERAGFFFSGGIDALATLRANRLHYPSDHPGSIKDGLIVFGLEVTDPKAFEYVVSSLSILAKDANITLIPVYTNIRIIGPDDISHFWEFWEDEFMGATFSAIGHVFSRRLTRVSESSDHDIPNIYPFSSHPLINPNYSSFDLRIRLENIALSRFERTGLVANWDHALRHLRVCNKPQYYKPEVLNCGECEKCVRTMLSLQTLGVLEKASSFPIHTVTAEQIEKTGPLAPNTFFFWSDLIEPLTKQGRYDLLRAVEQKIERYHQTEKRKSLRKSFIEPIIKYDEQKLGGTLRRLKRFMYSKGIWN